MKIRKEHVTHPDRSLRFLHLELDAFAAPRHAHRHVELTWVERGRGLRLVGDDASPFEPGDLVLLGPEVPHTWLTTNVVQQGRPRASVIQFAPEWLSESTLPELRRAASVLHAASAGLSLHGQLADTVTQAMRAMREGDDYLRLAGLVHIVGRLLGAPAEERVPIATARQRPADRGATPPRRADAVIDWMQRNLAGDLRVEDAARLAHVTPAAFSRWFRREVGKTFTQYLNDMRFSAACLALRQSSRPVATVAADCGFATMSHFNRQFRLRAGMTPREHRLG